MATDTISAVAKTKLYVGGVTSGQELTDYEAATFIEVTELADIGEFGDEANIITFETIGDGRVKKAVGTRRCRRPSDHGRAYRTGSRSAGHARRFQDL